MVYRLVIDPNQNKSGRILLEREQLHYLTRVVRLSSGDRFIVLDGRGNSWLAELADGETANLIATIEADTELAATITSIVALPKGNGFEEIIRCCTELGVSKIVPAIAQRTLLKPSPRKLERWRKIATEAAEQSERQIVPIVEEPVSFARVLQNISQEEARCYICVARSNVPHLKERLQAEAPQSTVIATGPEGGWTTAEIEAAIACGFQPVSLGKRILRAITAPIAALSIAAAVIDEE